MKKVIISLVIVMLLVALTLSIKSLYDNIHTNYKGSNQSAQNEKFKQEKKTKYKLPKINVLSQQFSENFMNSDVRNHYMHISKGMDKHKVETYFGDSEKTIQIANMKAHKYGDMAFLFKNNKVQRIFVVPDNVTIESFSQVHGYRVYNNHNGTMIYDDNPSNHFSVKVYFDSNKKVKAIENIDQVSTIK
ncbi:hypothetical protein ABC762_06275 [Staphylococcus ureilyticus]